jgi:hypothetical protein
MSSETERATLQKFIKTLLDDVSVPRRRYCSNCGSALLHLEAQVCLFGTEQVWNIPIPYCPNCDPAIAEHKGFII